MGKTESVAIAILETIIEAGLQGAPSGPMYMAVNAIGMNLDEYQEIMASLVATGMVREEHHCYYYIPKEKRA